MKQLMLILLVAGIFSCNPKESLSIEFRNEFSVEELEIMEAAKEIIEKSYYATFITVDKSGQPRARIMEPFAPEENFEIWLATNPRSRKVKQIHKNSKATIHYFDKSQLGYVSLMGKAYIVNDETIKAQKWKAGWEKFYVNQKEDYMLIRFVPEVLELIGIIKGLTGDETNWMPHQVILGD